MQIDFGELIAEDEQSVIFVQSFDKAAEIEVFDDVAYVPAESTDVVLKVEMDIVRVGFQSREVVLGGVVEARAYRFPNNPRYRVFGYFIFELIVGIDGFLFSSILVLYHF